MLYFRITFWENSRLGKYPVPFWLYYIVHISFNNVFPVTPKQRYITSSPPSKIHLSMPEGQAFIILNNWTQSVLVRYKRLSRKACLEALGLLSGVIVIGLKGYPFSLLPASQSPFLFTLLQGQRSTIRSIKIPHFLPLFIVLNWKY